MTIPEASGCPTSTRESSDTTVRKSVVVHVPIEYAFKVFTERFDSWWPKTHHIGKIEPFTAFVEPKEGGRWFERGVDGSECDWGRVLEYVPPTRLVLSWHLGPEFSYDPDLKKASRVEVTFRSEGEGHTRVDLVHSELDRHGAGWEKLRDSVGSKGGWSGVVELFATAASAPEAAS